jgi:hypothetical protein
VKRRPRTDHLILAVGTLALLAWAVSWIRTGTDTADGGYAVAAQLRLAQGDLPFADELSPQILGAIPGAPFVWLWHTLFGLSGIVLAARAFYLVVVLAARAVAWRALRSTVSAPAAFAGVAISCLAVPYSLPVLSYNTVPILASILSAAALTATVQTASRRWALLTGAALGVAATTNPQYLPAGIVLGIVAIAWLGRDLWIRVLAAAATPVVALGLWVLIVPGVSGARNSFSYMQDSRTVVAPAGERLRHNVDNLVQQLFVPSYLVLLALAALVTVAVLVRPRAVVSRIGIAVLPVAALVPVIRMATRDLPRGATSSLTPTGDIGVTTLHGSAVLVGVLLVPCVAWLSREGRRPLLALASYAAGLGLVVTPTLAASTASGPSRAVAAAGLAVPVLLLVTVAVEAAGKLRWAFAPLTSVAAVAAMAGIAAATSFPTVPAGDADMSVTSGAWAGMRGRPTDIGAIRAIGAALKAHTTSEDRVLAIGAPSALLMADIHAGTPMLWLTFGGDANERGVQWLEDHTPDAVLVYGYDAQALAGDGELSSDPLARYVRDNFTVVESSSTPSLTVLRRTAG